MLTHFRNTMAVLGLLCFANTSPAALTFTIEDAGPFTAGSTAFVTVFASASDGETLEDYRLTFDLGANGFGLPSGFSMPTISQETSIFEPHTVNATSTSDSGYDFNVEADAVSPPGEDIGSGNLALFTLAFATDPGTALGTYILGFLDPTHPSDGFVNDFEVLGSYTDLELESGSIEITAATAVPEPSSMLALSAVAGGVYLARRRRKQQNDAA